MVSDRVDIITKSYQEGAQAVKWSCDGSPEFTIDEVEKDDRGTDIVMHLSDDCKEFLEKERLEGLLKKFCHFLPVPVVFGKKQEWKDGKMQDTDEDNQVNDTTPLWTRKPADLKDEDYKAFYRQLYPMADEPLFWIHLNVDYPFNLTGILYFPKIKNNLDLQRNKIQLYCNQVFVTDQVEGIVPDFLTLLHGTIDSPDIPLNVSRSYLQSDANVKKISGYITKKVADRLSSLFKNDRKDFEAKWDDIKIFISYGMLTEDDFYEKAKAFYLVKDTEKLVYLYAADREAQYTYIDNARAKGYNVLLLDGQLDTPVVQMLERKLEKTAFTRVDSDVIDRLIQKDEPKGEELSADRSANLSAVFETQMPKTEKVTYHVETQPMGEDQMPVVITQSEYMRRMKDMAKIQPGMGFYGEMPDMYSLVLNTDNRLIKDVLEQSEAATAEALKPIEAELRGLNARRQVLQAEQDKKKYDEITDDERKDMEDCRKAIEAEEQKRKDVLADYAKDNERVHQLIDLALLQNGLLTGEALTRFVKRSVEMMG